MVPLRLFLLSFLFEADKTTAGCNVLHFPHSNCYQGRWDGCINKIISFFSRKTIFSLSIQETYSHGEVQLKFEQIQNNVKIWTWVKLNKFKKRNNTEIETTTKKFSINNWVPHDEQSVEQWGCTMYEDFKERIKGYRKRGPGKFHFGRGCPRCKARSNKSVSAACEIAQYALATTLPAPKLHPLKGL